VGCRGQQYRVDGTEEQSRRSMDGTDKPKRQSQQEEGKGLGVWEREKKRGKEKGKRKGERVGEVSSITTCRWEISITVRLC